MSDFQISNSSATVCVSGGDVWPVALLDPREITLVVASDILLYVSAYADLIKTLVYLFDEG